MKDLIVAGGWIAVLLFISTLFVVTLCGLYLFVTWVFGLERFHPDIVAPDAARPSLQALRFRMGVDALQQDPFYDDEDERWVIPAMWNIEQVERWRVGMYQ